MKVRIIFYVIAVALIGIIQTTLGDYIDVYGVKPNIMLIFVISISLLRGNIEGAGVGLVSGLFLDVVIGTGIGFYSLLGLYLGIVSGLLNKRLYRENVFVIAALSFIVTFIYEFLVFFFQIYISYDASIKSAISNVILIEAVYNGIISVFFYWIVIKINRKFESVEV